jgi:hypothetical protein
MFAQKALPHYEQTGKPKNFATEPKRDGLIALLAIRPIHKEPERWADRSCL